MTNTPHVSRICGRRELKTYMPSPEFVLPTCCIGLEFEYENARPLQEWAQQHALESFWEVHREGSLRGDGTELVLREPLAGYDLSRALAQIQQYVEDCGRKPDPSKRASVHAHLDVRDMELRLALYVAFLGIVMEGGLFHFAGPERRYNNFCVGNTLASGMLSHVSDMLMAADDDSARLALIHMAGPDEAYRYNAINLAALTKYGSIEFRHHEATLDFARVKDWINIIQSLKKYVLEHGELLFTAEWFNDFSNKGPRTIAREIFGPGLFAKLDYDSLDYDMYEGMRVVQEILYTDKMNKASLFKAKRQKKAKVVDDPINVVVNRDMAQLEQRVFIHGRIGPRRPAAMRAFEEGAIEPVVDDVLRIFDENDLIEGDGV